MYKLEEVLLSIMPQPVVDALIDFDGESIAELLVKYIEACPDGRGDIVAFFESNGAERVRELAKRDREEGPTAEELEEWFNKS